MKTTLQKDREENVELNRSQNHRSALMLSRTWLIFFLKAVRDFHLALIIMTSRHVSKADSARNTWWNHVIVQQGLITLYTQAVPNMSSL